MHQVSSGCGRVVTLRQVWVDYQLTGRLRPSTLSNYRQRLTTHLGDWLDLPITEISKSMVEHRHRQIKGDAVANSVMRTLRALLTYAGHKYEADDGSPLLKVNPVIRLSEIRAWHRERRRTRVIRPQQLREWFKAVYSINNTTLRDLLVFLLLTGLRKTEATSLKWEDVDLVAGIVHLKQTKNGDPFELPLSDFAKQILAFRKVGATTEYVFPGRGVSHASIGYKAYSAVAEKAGIPFSPHDLRRSFMTIADELDIKNQVIKALVNHRSDDVTEGYLIRSTERLRRATQQISTAILQYGGIVLRNA